VSARYTVILVGAGHVHLYVAAHAETLIEHGARVVLVDPTKFWYSGLATGMLGGMYEPAEDQVDPRALIQAHGGEFIQDRVDECGHRCTRRLRLAAGGDLAYDYLSFNVGSQVNGATVLLGRRTIRASGRSNRSATCGSCASIWKPVS
jgi:NADH dehydrogenase FAD-containing subunit